MTQSGLMIYSVLCFMAVFYAASCIDQSPSEKLPFPFELTNHCVVVPAMVDRWHHLVLSLAFCHTQRESFIHLVREM